GTNQFLDSTVKEARTRLADHEKKLEEYKMKYAGQLPTQLEANLQAMSQTMMQLQQINDGINRDREQKLFLEKQLKDFDIDPSRDVGPQATLTPATADNPARVTGGTAAQQLMVAKAYLAQLQGKYRDDWPDVKAWKRIVADLQQKADAEALSRPVTLGEA